MSRILTLLWFPASLAADSQRHLVYRSWWLWLVLLVTGIVLIRLVGSITSRRRRLARTGPRKRRRRIKDAWVEAGKRAEPEPVELDDLEDPDAREPGGGDER